LYSALLSRRKVTRPGSRGPLQLARARFLSSQPTMKSISWASGFGRPEGGISPERSDRLTFSQISRCLSAAASSLKTSNDSPALGFLPPWHWRQCFCKNGMTSREKLGLAAAEEFFLGSLLPWGKMAENSEKLTSRERNQRMPGGSPEGEWEGPTKELYPVRACMSAEKRRRAPASASRPIHHVGRCTRKIGGDVGDGGVAQPPPCFTCRPGNVRRDQAIA